MHRHLRQAGTIGALLAAAALHQVTPVGPEGWYVLHVVLRKLYYVPILLAGAWLGPRWTLGMTAAATGLYGLHVARDWVGQPSIQAAQVGEMVSFWVVGVLSATLFGKLREALREVRETHEHTLRALAGALDLREQETGRHSERVQHYALMLARRAGVDGPAVEALRKGALLHDVGKIGVPDRILLKPGELTEEEWEEMRRHPELGAALFEPIPFLREALAVILHHHERYDGSGYPRRLAAEAIPLAARIFAVADVFDALTTERPYRRPAPFEEAASYIASQGGAHFDPGVVEAFLSIPFAEWREAAAGFGVELEPVRRDERRERASDEPAPA